MKINHKYFSIIASKSQYAIYIFVNMYYFFNNYPHYIVAVVDKVVL